MNKFQSDVVQDALGDLNRAAAKLGMVATQLAAEAQALDGAQRSVVVEESLKLFVLGGSALLAIDRYKWPLNVMGVKP